MIDILALAVGLAALVAVVPLIIGCAQCFHRFLGFKDNAGYSQDIESGLGSTQDLPTADGTLYPPGESLDTDSIKGITFEPLPDIVGHQATADSALRPRVSTVAASENIRQAGYRYEVPRGQLFYVTEVGSGWFGQVLQGDAEKLRFGQTRTKVIVKVLKDDATAREQLQFLEEVRVFRELDHPNVLRFLGQCTETIPYLTILEHAANGDLKSYLLNSREDQEALLERGNLLKFACEMAAGLACMHRHEFIHRDFAARNCVVTNDFCVKVGDYGISEDIYKDDYMAVEDDMIPIRWMAPETVAVEDGSIRVLDITQQANIWSFGVALWELCMLGERPYNYMTNDGVVKQVILERFQQLPEPTTPVPFKCKVYDIMKFCWRDDRPDIDTVYKALQHLQMAVRDSMMAEFDTKWKLMVAEKRSRSGSQLNSGKVEKEVVVNGSGPPTGHQELRVKAEVLATEEEEIAGSPHPMAVQELAASSPGTDLIENWTPSKKIGEAMFQMTSTPIDKSEVTSSYMTPPSASTDSDAFATAKENLPPTPDSETTPKNLTEDLQKTEEVHTNVFEAPSDKLEDTSEAGNQEQSQDTKQLLIDVGSPDAPVSSAVEDITLHLEGGVLSRPDIIEHLVPRDVGQLPSDVQAASSDHLVPAQHNVPEHTGDPGQRDVDEEPSSQTANGQELAHAKVSDSGFTSSESFSLDLLACGKHSDSSSSRKPLDFSDEISFRRRSLLARDQMGMLPTIPEDRVPSISDGSVTDLNFDSFDDSSVIQDNFEWDEDIGRQLVGMVQDTTWDYSPRYGLELSDWSLDQSEISQLKNCKRDKSDSSRLGTNHRNHAIASSVLISDDSDEEEGVSEQEGSPDPCPSPHPPGNVNQSLQSQATS